MKEILKDQEVALEQFQYVTFSLNDEVYGIDALNVQEIIELTGITRVPNLPDYMKGVINLRGTIIPVIDLKTKFNMKTGDYKKHTCIIITEFRDALMGLIVDSVFDVLSVPGASLQPTPEFVTRLRTDFIRGLLRMDDKLIIILDINKVLSDEETTMVQEALKGEEGGNKEAAA